MSKNQPTAEVATTQPPAPPLVSPGPRFVARHPIAGFDGVECGVTFLAGEGRTDSGMFAHALLQNGCTVTDFGQPAFGSGDPEAIKRIEAVAAQRRRQSR